MKKNTLQNVVAFILKYIWLFCFTLVVLEIGGNLYTGKILMEETAHGVMNSVNGEVSGRVDGVVRLLQGLSKNAVISNTDIPLYDRAISMRPFQESYDLFMMALTDENVNVISCDEVTPPEKPTNLAYRVYMQELYKTGKFQISDVIKAGSDGVTLNYTIAVPIMKENKVVGSVFGAIYFKDIKDTLKGSSDSTHTFILLDSNQKTMGSDSDQSEEDFDKVASYTKFLTSSEKTIRSNMKNKISGATWEWGSSGLSYVVYQNVEPTNWTLVYTVEFISIFYRLLPTLLVKVLLYVIMCGMIFFFGRRYLSRHLASVNHLIDQVSKIQKELFANEQDDLNRVIELSQQGLVDQLTGLSTRAVLYQKMDDILQSDYAVGTIMFIDLDDLKLINDQYGHKVGDKALICFSEVLKKYEEEQKGLVSRYGGDEFLFVIPNMKEKDAILLAKNLGKELNITVHLSDADICIHSSIGIVCYPTYGTTLEELVAKADLALYDAKQDGKNGFYCFGEGESNHFN